MTHRESYKPGQHRSKHPVKRQRDRRRTDDEQRDDDANVTQLTKVKIEANDAEDLPSQKMKYIFTDDKSTYNKASSKLAW